MGHAVPIPDELYAAISAIAASQGVTADELMAEWLAEKVDDERRMALVDAAFENDEEWISGAREAMEEAEQRHVYQTLEECFTALGANEAELAEARRLDQA